MSHNFKTKKINMTNSFIIITGLPTLMRKRANKLENQRLPLISTIDNSSNQQPIRKPYHPEDSLKPLL